MGFAEMAEEKKIALCVSPVGPGPVTPVAVRKCHGHVVADDVSPLAVGGDPTTAHVSFRGKDIKKETS